MVWTDLGKKLDGQAREPVGAALLALAFAGLARLCGPLGLLLDGALGIGIAVELIFLVRLAV